SGGVSAISASTLRLRAGGAAGGRRFRADGVANAAFGGPAGAFAAALPRLVFLAAFGFFSGVSAASCFLASLPALAALPSFLPAFDAFDSVFFASAAAR